MNRRKEEDICLQEVTPISCFTLVSFMPVCFNAPPLAMTLLNLRSLAFCFFLSLALLLFIYLKFFPYRNISFVFRLLYLIPPASLHHCLICGLLLSILRPLALSFFHLFTSFFPY